MLWRMMTLEAFHRTLPRLLPFTPTIRVYFPSSFTIGSGDDVLPPFAILSIVTEPNQVQV